MEDSGQYEDVPEGMRTFILDTPHDMPPEYEEGVSEMWDLAHEGKCMACKGPLRTSTTMVLNAGGIAAIFCSGACMTDMANLGWLQENHDDIIDRMKFRGGEIDADGATPPNHDPDHDA